MLPLQKATSSSSKARLADGQTWAVEELPSTPCPAPSLGCHPCAGQQGVGPTWWRHSPVGGLQPRPVSRGRVVAVLLSHSPRLYTPLPVSEPVAHLVAVVFLN